MLAFIRAKQLCFNIWFSKSPPSGCSLQLCVTEALGFLPAPCLYVKYRWKNTCKALRWSGKEQVRYVQNITALPKDLPFTLSSFFPTPAWLCLIWQLCSQYFLILLFPSSPSLSLVPAISVPCWGSPRSRRRHHEGNMCPDISETTPARQQPPLPCAATRGNYMAFQRKDKSIKAH